MSLSDKQFQKAGECAFPVPLYWVHNGITKRDYFAAKAMQALVTLNLCDDQVCIAQEAYELADAMLAERERES